MIYKIMFYGGISISVIMFIVSIVLFFKLNILKIIYDLSGVTAKRKIQEIKEQNIISGQKKYVPMALNTEKGQITGKLNISEKLKWKSGTDKLGKKSKIKVKTIVEETDTNEPLTTMLAEDTVSLNRVEYETELLQDLNDKYYEENSTEESIKSAEFNIVFDVLSIHTEEVI